MSERKSISIILIALALTLFGSYHIYYHFASINSDNLIKNYYVEKEDISNSVPKISTKDTSKESYLGIIYIPKINLKTGFYNIKSNKNNVNNSVTILKESVMPENDNSIIYLAAHSGIGKIAYFNDIDKLSNGDIINLSINNSDYQYTITDIYEMIKTGEIMVDHNINEKTLVLTTCSKNKNMQLVIVAKMLPVI